MNAHRSLLLAAAAAIPSLLATAPAHAHCQVPCGIYDHPARIAALKEDAATITKAIAQIVELSGKNDAQSFNQAARWTATKEEHASHIIEVVSEYFLTQVVKPIAADAEERPTYLQTLADCHAAMVAAMKTKQQCDPSAATALDAAIAALDARW
jgi:hypothetical protein